MQLQSKTLHSVLINFLLGSLILVFFTIDSAAQEKVTTPKNFFGFKMGADRKLARWDKIVDYFFQLDAGNYFLPLLIMFLHIGVIVKTLSDTN